MSNLVSVIEYLFPGISFQAECRLVDAGDGVRIADWNRPEPQPTPAQIEAAVLPATKAQRIAQLNAECTRRLINRWGPPERQVSVLAGIYGSAERDLMTASISAHVDASNDASDAVLRAATVEAAEAVVPNWPELPA